MQSESRTSPGPSQQGNMSAERDQPQMRGGELQTGEAQGQDGPSTEAQSDAPAARFTAVNNKEPLSNATPNNSGVNNEMRRPSQPEYPPRITPPGQEKLTITTTNTDRENWADTVNGPRNGSHNVPPPPSFSEGSNPHKRKRSGSFGGERESDQSNSAGSYHKHSLPAIKANSDLKGSPDTPYPDSAASKINPESATRDPYATPQTPYGQYGGDGRENASWYTQNSAVSEHHLSAEQRLHEALQRDSNNNSDGQANFSETSPAQDDRSGAAYQGQYGQVQQDHKKRKRNFSNRTKTGCMTCRKRKKKCDESRPECNNCIRGGFVCNGYPSRGQWPKPDQKQGPVPLQAKDGYDASPSQTPQQYHSYSQPAPSAQSKREPLPSGPSYRGQQLRVDPLQPPARPLGDDDRASATTLASASVGSPDKRGLSATPYTPANPFPTPISAVSQQSAYPDRLGQMDYGRMPPLLEPGRNDQHEAQTPQSAHSTVPQISILHPTHSNSPHPHTPQSTAAQDAARLALSHPASNSRQRTQKEEMLQGKKFFALDRELTLERERCSAASWRFNNSNNPNNGNLPEDHRMRLFREILQPQPLNNLSQHLLTPNSPQGSVGEGLVVNAPFSCDYGYNITIGNDVLIERNCTIMDCVSVKIGDRCVIGPNVTILTTSVSVDPKKRCGSKGPSFGKPITIEQDCFIGANVVILPGITIRRGSTIGAGSVIRRDVPPFTVVSGELARVLGGIYNNEQ